MVHKAMGIATDGPIHRFFTPRGLYGGGRDWGGGGVDIADRRIYGEFADKRPFMATRIPRRLGGFSIDGAISLFLPPDA